MNPISKWDDTEAEAADLNPEFRAIVLFFPSAVWDRKELGQCEILSLFS